MTDSADPLPMPSAILTVVPLSSEECVLPNSSSSSSGRRGSPSPMISPRQQPGKGGKRGTVNGSPMKDEGAKLVNDSSSAGSSENPPSQGKSQRKQSRQEAGHSSTQRPVDSEGVSNANAARRNTSPLPTVKPEPPSQEPSANLFRRAFSVGNGDAHDGASPPLRGSQKTCNTPPPSAPTQAALALQQQHASSAPRDGRGPAFSKEDPTVEGVKTPRLKESFYPMISTPASTPSSTPRAKALAGASGDAPQGRGSAPSSRTAKAGPDQQQQQQQQQQSSQRLMFPATPSAGSSAATSGSPPATLLAARKGLPPLAPQSSRSGIPRTLTSSQSPSSNGNTNTNNNTNNNNRNTGEGQKPPPQPPLKKPFPLLSPISANSKADGKPLPAEERAATAESARGLSAHGERRQPPRQLSFGFMIQPTTGDSAADTSPPKQPQPKTAGSNTSGASPPKQPQPKTVGSNTGSKSPPKPPQPKTVGSNTGSKSPPKPPQPKTVGSNTGSANPPKPPQPKTAGSNTGSKSPPKQPQPKTAASIAKPPVPPSKTPAAGKEAVPLAGGGAPKTAPHKSNPKPVAPAPVPPLPTAKAAATNKATNNGNSMPSLSITVAGRSSLRNSPETPSLDLKGASGIDEEGAFPIGSLASFPLIEDRYKVEETDRALQDSRDSGLSATPSKATSTTRKGPQASSPPPQPPPPQKQIPAAPSAALKKLVGLGGDKDKDKDKATETTAAAAAPSQQSRPFEHRPRQPSALANSSCVRPGAGGGAGGGNQAVKASEAAALASYLGEEELNLSMSTFTALGSTLSHSHALRVLNLRGSTMSSEGLRGLADIPTLQSICVSHMRKLTSLRPLITPTNPHAKCALLEIDAQCTPLKSDGLAGLEKLPRLRKLDLSMTAVTDVSQLSASVSLKELYLALTHVTSEGIQGLERIPTLVTLNVSRTKVTTLQSLTASRSLHTLLLYSCKTTDDDIKGIEKMPRLAVVDLSTTKVTDLSIFRDSPSLQNIKAQWLSLKNCVDLIQERRGSIADTGSGSGWQEAEAGYAGLADVPTLETVDLSFNSIRSVRSLCSSTSIRHLILRRTRVDSAGIAEIHRLARTLETLEVTNLTDCIEENSDDDGISLGASTTSGGNGLLSNINVLSRLTKLTRIDLSFTDVFDLRMLRGLPFLKELVIVETLVTADGLRGIEQIPSLELLDLSQTSVMSLQFLAGGAASLKRILVKSNRNVRGFRLGQIEGLPSLESLDISDTVVEDIRMMWTPAWRLKELIWRWRERREAVGPVAPLACWVISERLMGIATMPSLEKLDIANSVVQNLDFLVGAPKITSLNLDGCRLLRDRHISAISGEAFVRDCLEEINLANNPHLSDLTCLSRCKRLRTLCIANDTGLHAPGLEGVWNLPTIKELDINNSGAEEAVWLSQQSDRNAAFEGSLRATSSPNVDSTLSSKSQDGGAGSSRATAAGASPSRGGGPSANGDGGAHSGTKTPLSTKKEDPKKQRKGRPKKEDGALRDVSAVLDNSVTPAEFKVPRRRRVSFATVDPPHAPIATEGANTAP